eukprot:GHVU01069393.1.p1 GENE.GHVU01069393.1~~GHVU01069393.1.p1  ORF type:complete len:153 (+),score=6.41 GHVU01069393.1:961-1419(+)
MSARVCEGIFTRSIIAGQLQCMSDRTGPNGKLGWCVAALLFAAAAEGHWRSGASKLMKTSKASACHSSTTSPFYADCVIRIPLRLTGVKLVDYVCGKKKKKLYKQTKREAKASERLPSSRQSRFPISPSSVRESTSNEDGGHVHMTRATNEQ